MKIGFAMGGALLIIFSIPGFLKMKPHIPSREEIEMYAQQMKMTAGNTFLNIKKTLTGSLAFPYQTSVQIISEQITPTIVQNNYWAPTFTPTPKLSGTPQITPSTMVTPSKIPSPTSRPTSSIKPTVVPTKYIPPPTSTPIPIPTLRPTAHIPPPTSTPVPAPTEAVRTLDYSQIQSMPSNPPVIGCRGGTTSGCPVDQLYYTALDRGLGWATYYGDEQAYGYSVVADVIHNRKGISMDDAHAFISETFMERQSHLTPEQARATGKVMAYGATRGPSDLWSIKYLFGIDDASNPQPRFIGRVMIIDMAAPQDWSGNLAKLTYSYKGWSGLNWIVDLSKNGFIQIPTGYSGQQDNLGEGRPGVVLIDESVIDQYIY